MERHVMKNGDIIVAIIGGLLLLMAPFLIDKTKNEPIQIIPIERMYYEE